MSRATDPVFRYMRRATGSLLLASYRENPVSISVYTADSASGPWHHLATIVSPHPKSLSFCEPHMVQLKSKCRIKIAQTGHLIAADIPDFMEPYYDHGPMFLFSDSVNVSTLGRTVIGDKKIVLSFHHDLGKVFLTGAHPEFENSRISWVMLKNAITWCSE